MPRCGRIVGSSKISPRQCQCSCHEAHVCCVYNTTRTCQVQVFETGFHDTFLKIETGAWAIGFAGFNYQQGVLRRKISMASPPASPPRRSGSRKPVKSRPSLLRISPTPSAGDRSPSPMSRIRHRRSTASESGTLAPTTPAATPGSAQTSWLVRTMDDWMRGVTAMGNGVSGLQI